MATRSELFPYGGGLRFVADHDGESYWIELPDELLAHEVGAGWTSDAATTWLNDNIGDVIAAAMARLDGKAMDARFKRIFVQEKS